MRGGCQMICGMWATLCVDAPCEGFRTLSLNTQCLKRRTASAGLHGRRVQMRLRALLDKVTTPFESYRQSSSLVHCHCVPQACLAAFHAG